MAFCRKCGAPIDEAANSCPECGEPQLWLAAHNIKRGVGIALVAIVAIAILGAIFGTDNNKPAPKTNAVTTLPGFTAEEKVYLAQAGQTMLRVADAMDTEANVLTNGAGSSSQVASLAAPFDVVRNEYKLWKNREAPSERFSKLHGLWLQALKYLNDSVNDFAKGLEDNDLSLLDKGDREVRLGTATMNKAHAEIIRLKTEYGE